MLAKTPPQSSFWDTHWIEHLIDRESFEWHFRRVIRPLICPIPQCPIPRGGQWPISVGRLKWMDPLRDQLAV